VRNPEDILAKEKVLKQAEEVARKIMGKKRMPVARCRLLIAAYWLFVACYSLLGAFSGSFICSMARAGNR